jgi:hypothetical protein
MVHLNPAPFMDGEPRRSRLVRRIPASRTLWVVNARGARLRFASATDLS